VDEPPAAAGGGGHCSRKTNVATRPRVDLRFRRHAAETEEIHRQAFNDAFVQMRLDWRWGRTVYKQLLKTAGGKERIRAFDHSRRSQHSLSDQEILELHRIKTSRYAELIASGDCRLRPGVEALLKSARWRSERLAIATTTSFGNIDGLLSAALGKDWAGRFDAVVAGDEVPRKKPAPDVYLEVLRKLALPASDCVAIEDSHNGLVAATLAGIPVMITRSVYFQDEDFSKALLAVNDLTELFG
jgi:HAD superfamily hydrolase (TIGR01509 family)